MMSFFRKSISAIIDSFEKEIKEVYDCKVRVPKIVIFFSKIKCIACLIVLFVGLWRELRSLHELLKVALSLIYHVVVIWSECCGPVAWAE